MLKQNKKGVSKTLINVVIDLALLVAFLVVIDEKSTGVVIHEWLGVGIFLVIVVHVLLHWDWVVGITKRFFKKLKAEPRINYFVDLGIFIGFITIIFSGLMISEIVMPLVGLRGTGGMFWKQLHYQATDITLYLAAIHLALHWRWIKSVFTRYLVNPVVNLFKRPKPAVVPVEVPAQD